VQRRGREIVTRFGRVRIRLAPVTTAAVACLILAGCSPGADYPSLFPASHDMPPPRGDTPLDPAQVQQATEDLITARNHLSAETQGGKPAANAPKETADKKNQPAVAPPAKSSAATPPAAGKPLAIEGAQTAGAETKP
jgi:hypothetical protein